MEVLRIYHRAEKIGVLVGSNLVLCAMSDLMISGIKGVIEKTAPIVNDISPAALITDAFYALNVYDTYERFFVDVLSLAGLTVLLGGICIWRVRRNRYASI